MLVIGNAMFESGVAQKIGNVVMRVSGGSERKFILFAGGTSIIMSMFLANMAVIAMYLAVMSSVCRTNPNVKLKNICLATTMGAMFGGVCTLVGSTPQLTMQTILEGAAGQTAGMWDFMPVGLCLSAVYLLYVLFIGYPLGKKIWGKDDGSENLDELDTLVASRAVKVEEDTGHKRKQIYMYIILIMLVVFFATEIVSNVMPNVYFKEALQDCKNEIIIGQPLSKPLEQCGLFPPMVYHMTRIGEETGATEEMLAKQADYYEEEVEAAVASFMAAMEPVIIIVLAAIVLVLVGACLMPMMTMYETLNAM